MSDVKLGSRASEVDRLLYEARDLVARGRKEVALEEARLKQSKEMLREWEAEVRRLELEERSLGSEGGTT